MLSPLKTVCPLRLSVRRKPVQMPPLTDGSSVRKCRYSLYTPADCLPTTPSCQPQAAGQSFRDAEDRCWVRRSCIHAEVLTTISVKKWQFKDNLAGGKHHECITQYYYGRWTNWGDRRTRSKSCNPQAEVLESEKQSILCRYGNRTGNPHSWTIFIACNTAQDSRGNFEKMKKSTRFEPLILITPAMCSPIVPIEFKSSLGTELQSDAVWMAHSSRHRFSWFDVARLQLYATWPAGVHHRPQRTF